MSVEAIVISPFNPDIGDLCFIYFVFDQFSLMWINFINLFKDPTFFDDFFSITGLLSISLIFVCA